MPIGPTELVLILVLVLIIFGAGKIPQVMNQLGKSIKEFRETAADVDATIAPRTEIANAAKPSTPSSSLTRTE
jgi:sec-independent protein translocase protein TatA